MTHQNRAPMDTTGSSRKRTPTQGRPVHERPGQPKPASAGGKRKVSAKRAGGVRPARSNGQTVALAPPSMKAAPKKKTTGVKAAKVGTKSAETTAEAETDDAE